MTHRVAFVVVSWNCTASDTTFPLCESQEGAGHERLGLILLRHRRGLWEPQVVSSRLNQQSCGMGKHYIEYDHRCSLARPYLVHQVQRMFTSSRCPALHPGAEHSFGARKIEIVGEVHLGSLNLRSPQQLTHPTRPSPLVSFYLYVVIYRQRRWDCRLVTRAHPTFVVLHK